MPNGPVTGDALVTEALRGPVWKEEQAGGVREGDGTQGGSRNCRLHEDRGLLGAPCSSAPRTAPDTQWAFGKYLLTARSSKGLNVSVLKARVGG